MAILKKLPHSEIELTFSVDWNDWKKHVNVATTKASESMNIKGFRPGKAPKNMVEQRVGTTTLLEAAAETAIDEVYRAYLEKEKIDVIGSPHASITKIAEGNSLEFVIKTAVVPKAELSSWDSAVKKISAQTKKEGKVEITDEEVDTELEKIAKGRAKLVTVDREARDGDNVLVDFTVKRDGVPIENGTSLKHPLLIGSGVFIPGFEDHVKGMKFGDEKEFELDFPKDYHAKHLAGKPATFSVKMNEVQERIIPVIDDEFVKTLGKLETLSALKENLKEGMIKEKEQAKKAERRQKVLDVLIEATSVELPPVLIDHELEKMFHEFSHQIEGMGLDMKSYLDQVKKTKEDLEKEWRPQAERRIKGMMAVEKVAEDRGITVPSEEMEAEMNKTLQYYKNSKDLEKNIDVTKLYEYVKGVMINEKVFEYLEKLQS